MLLTIERKKKLIQDFGKNERDSGSSEVQIAFLTDRIHNLTEHLKEHRHDFSSKRGLLKLVAQRNKFLRYLQRTNTSSYEAMTKRLNLRK